MNKIDELKLIVCNARYFCNDFPASFEQRSSFCYNCNERIRQNCIAGIAQLPVICKNCYDVLKYTFEIVEPKSRCNSEINIFKPTVIKPSSSPFFDDEKIIVSNPKHILSITEKIRNSPLQE